MDNYEVLEVIHASRTSETIILKVKEKNKRICDKVYALKLIGSLNNRFQKLIFKREVDALKTLNSCDNIVKIRDYMLNAEFRGKNDWGLILLDYVDGTNLEELDLSNFSQVEKYELCLKILKAIEEAHNYNVLHRDIKPSNIMYNIETGEVKIIDFGTSKIKSIVEQETTLPFYSPNFSAPEVVKGNSTTEASDIYSLGAVIFYILFGMLPNGTEMICRTLQDLEVPENLGILIAKMVAEEPENRFQEVGTVIDAFEEIIGDNSSQKDTYLCSIDVDKLRYLKNPLFFNFAISGYGNRLTIEKIHIEGCPQCGGKMKYYNKPVEWREILRSDGSTKREVTKRIPVLECKRNAEHWYAVDPAEDRVK